MRPFLAIVLLGSTVASRAYAVEFRIDDAWGRDTVQFRTTAPLEDVVGSTNQKNVEIPAQLAYLPKKEVTAKFRPGNHLRIKSDFDVTLSEYGIDRKGPILKLQVGETAHVSLSILATDATDEELAEYRAGAKKWLGNDARTN